MNRNRAIEISESPDLKHDPTEEFDVQLNQLEER